MNQTSLYTLLQKAGSRKISWEFTDKISMRVAWASILTGIAVHVLVSDKASELFFGSSIAYLGATIVFLSIAGDMVNSRRKKDRAIILLNSRIHAITPPLGRKEVEAAARLSHELATYDTHGLNEAARVSIAHVSRTLSAKKRRIT